MKIRVLHTWRSQIRFSYKLAEHAKGIGMKILEPIRRLLQRKPTLSFGHSGVSPDPSKTYEFLFVANFSEQRSAGLCALAVSNLNLVSKVEGLPNGR
jgi:hypothetical protein